MRIVISDAGPWRHILLTLQTLRFTAFILYALSVGSFVEKQMVPVSSSLCPMIYCVDTEGHLAAANLTPVPCRLYFWGF